MLRTILLRQCLKSWVLIHLLKWKEIDAKKPNKQYDETKRKRTIVLSWRQEFGQWLITDVNLKWQYYVQDLSGTRSDVTTTEYIRKSVVQWCDHNIIRTGYRANSFLHTLVSYTSLSLSLLSLSLSVFVCYLVKPCRNHDSILRKTHYASAKKCG